MKYVKVLDKNLRPPIQGGKQYKIGVWHHCENFDTSNAECAPGFYVIPVSELIRYHKPWLGTKVLPAEIKGKSKIFSPAKQRYEYMKLDNPLSDEQIKTMCKEIEPELGYKLIEALYPVNPLLCPKATVTVADIDLLKKWINIRCGVWHSVWDSIRDRVMHSIWDSVWQSVRDSVMDSVMHNVWQSVRQSVLDSVSDSFRDRVLDGAWDRVRESLLDSSYAYIGSLFYGIEKWKYIDHKSGVYKFQSVVDLWYRGIIPVYCGRKWMLVSGKKAEIVWQEPEIGWLKAQGEEK
ncbi:MAG: hypothetical protein RBT65_12620 [Methanolobus sp.]|nr:hypothetical protein [Methanolobus sp.]